MLDEMLVVTTPLLFALLMGLSDAENFHSLAESLKSVERLIEFSVIPGSD